MIPRYQCLRQLDQKQNSFLSNYFIIPIKGVLPADTMFYLETQLQQIHGITEVLELKQNLSEGWYSIMTPTTTLKQNIKLLKGHLVTWVTEIIDTQGIHLPQFPKSTLCFKGKQSKEESNGNDSCLSACSTTYSYVEYSIDEVPTINEPSTQAWPAPLSLPGTIEATTSTGVSALSRDKFDLVTNDNA